MKNFLRPFVALSFVFLSACATAPGASFNQVDVPADGKGNVYLYRTSAFFAMGQGFHTVVDGQDKGLLFNKSYLLFTLTPGEHNLTVAPGGMGKDSNLPIQVEAGKTSFYQYDFVTGPLANFFFVGSSIAPREKDVALPALAELKSATADTTK